MAFHLLAHAFEPGDAKFAQAFAQHQSFKKLLPMLSKRSQSKELALSLPPGELQNIAERSLSQLEQLGIRIITLLDDDYPVLLREALEPPLGFYLLGQLPRAFPLAIVGTRKAGHYGLNLARTFAADLARVGATVVSGLAYGIDQAAARGALDGGGQTIAVLGEAIDLVLKSPKGNLAKEIVAHGGGIISEHPPGKPGSKASFPLRNRIIAGLCRGTIVIEAPIDSGALITARHALESNREVFVVPGELTNQNFAGSHRLIQQGAKLVTRIEDILTEFDFSAPTELRTLELAPQEQTLCDLLRQNALTLLELQTETELATGELLALLTHLEIRGVVKNVGGKFTAT